MRPKPLFVRISSLFVFILFAMCGTSAGQKLPEEMPMSVRMSRSEMARNPESWQLDFQTVPKWNYSGGLECKAILDAADYYGLDDLYAYVEKYTDVLIKEDGTIKTYKPEDYNIDQINSGRLLFRLYEHTGKEKYMQAVRLLRSQLDSHPRTPDGGFWHKKIYPQQMWLDGLYMGMPFYAEYALRNGEKDKFADIVRQFVLVGEGTKDMRTGLYRHAFDHSRSMFWAEEDTGRSAHAWGRALGWYAMALVDVLDFIPADEPGRDSLLTILADVIGGLKKYRDPATGLFYQVLDEPGREGNYLEATCCSMFAYSILKGVRMGYLSADHLDLGVSVYEALVREFIKTDDRGLVSLTKCCAVAGLGGKENRDGSFAYYISEPVRDNDAKGVGPFIMASLEMERIAKNHKID